MKICRKGLHSLQDSVKRCPVCSKQTRLKYYAQNAEKLSKMGQDSYKMQISIKLQHYTNLQYLTPKDNLKKGSKYSEKK